MISRGQNAPFALLGNLYSCIHRANLSDVCSCILNTIACICVYSLDSDGTNLIYMCAPVTLQQKEKYSEYLHE